MSCDQHNDPFGHSSDWDEPENELRTIRGDSTAVGFSNEHKGILIVPVFFNVLRLNSPAHMSRWEQVQKEVKATDTYHLTETELVFGAKLAWRNSVRCIGRIQWSKLQVFDCRYVTTTSGMFEALCNHIKYSTNKGNIRLKPGTMGMTVAIQHNCPMTRCSNPHGPENGQSDPSE
uniref:nitric-oxide synthase (NADPH) n=1 Tax=Timema cristinae TaxID=61476 RepID=A0A7R9D4R3_TIMCR|nr:unnamed protein product [Timema cristinae]